MSEIRKIEKHNNVWVHWMKKKRYCELLICWSVTYLLSHSEMFSVSKRSPITLFPNYSSCVWFEMGTPNKTEHFVTIKYLFLIEP